MTDTNIATTNEPGPAAAPARPQTATLGWPDFRVSADTDRDGAGTA